MRLRALASIAAACLAAACSPGPSAPPNVLLVIVDDLNCDIACYGSAEVRTPHIDALAARGVRFDNAYAQAAACNPSRASLLTGRDPLTTRVLDNHTSLRDALPDAVTLGQHFRSHGYFTAAIGKIAHRAYDEAEDWDRRGKLRVRPPEDDDEAPAARPAGRKRAERWAVPGSGDTEPDHQVASATIALLGRLEREPFFLAVGFDSPHPPLVAPQAYYDLYRDSSPALPADFAAAPVAGAPSSRENTGLFEARRASKREARAMTRAYRATTSFVDAQLGRVLAELDRRGLSQRTLVVLASDHGFHLGDKGLWGKATLFERGLRVPLVIAGPGVAAGASSPRPVQLLDLYPTLVELAQLPPPGPLDGHSLVPLLRDPLAPWPHPARSWLARGDVMGASLRDERYRYTEWDEGRAGRELYDHATDPGETRNLAGDPRQAGTLARLGSLLRAASSE